MTEFSQDDIDSFVSAAAVSPAKRVRDHIASGIGLNVKDRSGRTPLYAAAESNNINVIRSLLKAGADPNQLSTSSNTNRGGSPLNAACHQHDHAAIQAMLGKGANPKVLDDSYQSAAHCLLRSYRGTTNLALREVANILVTLERLIKAGTPLDQPTKLGKTLLSIAVEETLPAPILNFLLEKGANPNQTINDGKTVMHEAACAGNIEMVKILARHGADVNAVDNLGRTPLFHVLTGEAAFELIALGANLHHVDFRGLDPLSYLVAECRNSEDVMAPIEYILSADANLSHRDWSGRSSRYRQGKEPSRS